MNTVNRFGETTLRGGIVFIVLVIFLMIFVSSGVVEATFGDVFLVSADNEGTIGNNASQSAAVSASGRYVVFNSFANNLVVGDTNNASDIFLKDMQTQQICLVSHSLGGDGPANGPSMNPSISADGRFVSFTSDAFDLVENDTNQTPDVFVWDALTQEVVRVSTSWSGAEGDGFSGGSQISGNGQWVVFTSDSKNLVPEDTNLRTDIFVRNVVTWELSRLVPSFGVEPNGASYEPKINLDGSCVVFSSTASNWVSTGAWSGFEDIYLYDSTTNEVSYVVRSTEGGPADSSSSFPMISPNGRYVVFQSFAENLSSIDTNGFSDVYMLDTISNTLSLVSVDSFGGESDNNSGLFGATVNDSGHVVFESMASDLTSNVQGFLSRLYLHKDGHTILLIGGGGQGEKTHFPAFTAQDSVIFESLVPNLVVGDNNGTWDVFLLDVVPVVPTETPTPTSTPTPSPSPTPTVTPEPPVGFETLLPFVVRSSD